MNCRFSQDSDFKILRFPQIPSSSANASVSAEIFQRFQDSRFSSRFHLKISRFPRFYSVSLLKIRLI
jgi:hypothetical protein